MTDQVVSLRIVGNGRAAVVAVEEVSSAQRELGATGERAGAQASRGMNTAARSARSLADETTKAKFALASLATAVAATFSVREIVASTNALAGFDQGLKAARGSQQAATSEMEFLRRETNRLGLELLGSAQAYTSLTAAARGTTLEGAQTRAIFIGVSEAARVLHLSSDQVNGALNAIQQMMSKGNVQAEELRGQLGERLPGAFNLAAKAMGVTTAQLNKMLDDGKVLATDLLPKLAEELHRVYGGQAAEAASLPAAEIARLKNAIVELEAAVGNAGFLGALAAGAVALTQVLIQLTQSGALDTIVAGLGAIAVVAATAFGGRILGMIGQYVAGLRQAAQQQIVSAALDREWAQQKVAIAQARAIEITRTLEVVSAARQEAVAKVAVAAADLEAAKAHLAAAQAAGVQSYALRQVQVATESLTAARARQAALTTELASLGAAQAALQTRLAGAAGEQIAAQGRLNASLGLGGLAMNAFRAAGSGLLALLGGWPGVLLAAGAALLYFANQSDAVDRAVDRASSATQALRDAREEGIASAVQAAEAEYKITQETLRGEEAKLKALATGLSWADKSAAWLGITTDTTAAYVLQANRVAELSQTYGKLGQALDDARARQLAFNVAASFDAELTNAAQAGLDRSKAAKSVIDDIKKENAEMEKKVALFGKGAEATTLYEKAQRLAALSTQADTTATRAQREEIERAYVPLIASAKAYDAANAAKKAATAASKEERKEMREAAADTQRFVEQLEKKIATYGLSESAQMRYELGALKLTDAKRAELAANMDVFDALQDVTEQEKTAADALKTLDDLHTSATANLADLADELAGADAAQLAFNRTLREAKAAFAAAGGAANPDAVAAYRQALEGAATVAQKTRTLDAVQKKVDSLKDSMSQFGDIDGFNKLADQIKIVEDALTSMHDASGKALDPAQVEALQRALGEMRHAMVTGIVDSATAGLRSLQSMTTEGSKAFRAMQVAIDALAVVQAISAVLNQGMGDPYTAFARMAAMAAAVAQLGVSIGSFGGGGPSSQSAEVRQARQGTGTVLGDVDAKSESIARAIDITAAATTELVGLNRGMLNALRALQSALGAAGGLLARGAGDVAFPGTRDNTQGLLGPLGNVNPLLGALTSDPISNAIGGFLWGGKQKVIDQGIVIAGGALRDMLDRIVVGAYQTIKEDGGLFGSDSTFDNVVDISGTFGKQFQLVIRSIADTVREGATALGLLPADVEAAIAAYKIEEIRISLKGLSAEDQQAELQAVFSQIFDGLAVSVVPWVEKYQRVGEGIGETLVRIATQVQVAQEAFRQLGLAVDQSDPERFADISDALIEASGGLDSFITNMQSFVEKFAPEGHQFAVATDALTSALDQVGLSVPATRDGMWELMQSLDATTAEGREQIATLLRLADVSAQYYDALDDQAEQLASARETLDGLGMTRGLSDFGRRILDIRDSAAKANAAANSLAKAQGAEGASAIQLSAIKLWALRQEAAAVRQLVAEINQLKADLYGDVPGSLDLINQRIAELEGAAGAVAGGVDTIREAGNNLFEQWSSGVKSVQDYLDSMLLGEMSNLTPEQKVDEARRQLLDTQAAAMRGDTAALAKLPQLADAFLRLQRGSLASGDDWNAQVDWVRQLLGTVAGMDNPYSPPGSGGTGNNGNYTVTPSPELEALYAARDAAMAEQYAEQRRVLAQQLVEHLADYADLMKVPVLELIEAQGLDLRQLATDLGANLDDITSKSVEVLGNMAVALGVPLGELVTQLGLSMPDLKQGLVDLTTQLGIDLTALTSGTAEQISATTTQLAALAGSLGTNLSDLSEALGVDLGKLTDIDSPIFQALKDNINTLSPAIKEELTPLLDAVRLASGDVEKNAAVKALRDHVDALAPELKNQLGPFFTDIVPAKALDQLDFLSEIRDVGRNQLAVLGRINSNLAAVNNNTGIPSYAIGTGFVGRDQLANIHYGEAVVPAHVNAWFQRANWQLPRAAANDDRATVAEIRALREEIAQLRRENAAGHGRTAQTIDSGNTKARAQLDDMTRALSGNAVARTSRHG